MVTAGAVFLDALGPDAARLHPQLRAAFRAEQSIVRAEGVFRVAGSPFRGLTAVARPLVGAGLLVTCYERDVSFTVTMVPGRTASGAATLQTTRELRFASGTQRIVDLLTVTPHHGVVHNVLGAEGRIQLLEECSVGPGGELRMSTRALAIRVFGRRIRLRGVLAMRVDVVDGWDEDNARRTISLRAVSPLVGTVLRYEGWYRPAPDAGIPAKGSAAQ